MALVILIWQILCGIHATGNQKKTKWEEYGEGDNIETVQNNGNRELEKHKLAGRSEARGR